MAQRVRAPADPGLLVANKVDLVPEDRGECERLRTKANTLVAFSTGEGPEAIGLCD